MRLLMVFLYMMMALTAFSQDVKKLDSMLRILPVAKEDSSKVLLLLSIADEYEVVDLEKARPYLDRALSLSKRINYPQGIMKTYRHFAYLYSYQSKFDSSIYVNRMVLDIARQLKDSFSIGAAYFNIGGAYRFRQDLDSALQYTLEGARLLDGKGYGNVESALNDGLQSLYMSMAQYEKAVQYGEKAVALARKYENMEDLTTSLNNLGMSYVETGRMDDAKKAYQEGLEVAGKIGYQQLEAMLLNNFSDILIREGKFDEAGSNAARVLKLQESIRDSSTIMYAKIIQANYYLSKGEYEKSIQAANEAGIIAERQSMDDGKIGVLAVLARVAYAQKQFSKGLEYDFQQDKIQEGIFNESVKQREASWRVRYETEKKDNQIQSQKAQLFRKSVLNYILIGGIAVLALLSFMAYRNHLHRQKIQQQRINELETEKQLAATEAVLRGEEQERARLAKDLHDGLGGMLSGIKFTLNNMKGNMIMTPENAQAFERSMDMLNSSIGEMRRVAHNMMPEALVKFGLDTALRDFCNDVTRSGALNVRYQSFGLEEVEIEQTKTVTIYRIVQELLNNAMKHASAKNVLVQLTNSNGQLTITVEDDGKGFDPSVLNQSKGMGWNNILNRVEFLKGKWDVDSAPGKGTSVHIELTA